MIKDDDYNSVMKSANHTLELDSEDFEAHADILLCYAAKKEFDKGFEYLDNLFKKYPNRHGAFYCKAIFYMELHSRKYDINKAPYYKIEAIAALEEALKLASDDIKLLWNAASIYECYADNYIKAYELLEKGYRISNDEEFKFRMSLIESLMKKQIKKNKSSFNTLGPDLDLSDSSLYFIFLAVALFVVVAVYYFH